MDEIWKPIDWIDGIPKWKYQISNMGKLYSTCARGGLIKTRVWNGTVVATITNKPDANPGDVDFVKKTLIITRAVAIAFNEFPSGYDMSNIDQLHVKHIDGNRLNLSNTNLVWSVKTNNPDIIIPPELMKRIVSIISENVSKSAWYVSELVLAETGVLINKATIDEIALGKTHLSITNNPLRDKKNFFICDEDYHIICQSLLRNGGCSSHVAQELFEQHALTTREYTLNEIAFIASHVKCKTMGRWISDQYFKEPLQQTIFDPKIPDTAVPIDVYEITGNFIITLPTTRDACHYDGCNMNSKWFREMCLDRHQPVYGYLFYRHGEPIVERWKRIDWIDDIYEYYISDQSRVISSRHGRMHILKSYFTNYKNETHVECVLLRGPEHDHRLRLHDLMKHAYPDNVK